MMTMTLNVPEALEKQHDKTVRLIAAKLYEAGEVTLGQAAEMAGATYREFVDLLPGYGVSLINYSVEELQRELTRNAIL